MNIAIFNVIITIAAIVSLAGFIVSLVMIRKQQHKETDEGLNSASAKHYLTLNPALIAYVLFPLLIAFGAYLLYVYLY